jgi:protein-disulfide isomerase
MNMRSRFDRFAIPLFAFLLLSSAACIGQASGPAKAPASREPKLNTGALAVVGDQTISEDDLLPHVQGQLYQLQVQEYEIKSKALDDLINQKLLEAEAKKRGTTSEKVLEEEVDKKTPEPSETELQAVYMVQKDQSKRSFDEVKPQIQRALKQATLQQARQDFYKRLREQAGVAILLTKPKVQVGYDLARLRGNPKASVVIVEFSDFQCPYCRAVEPTLKKVLAKYGDRVSLAYRDLPLRDIHPQAQMAAEASRCAEEQGKFWEYHDLIFDNPGKLSREGFIEHARSLKLDDKQFDSCLSGEKYQAQIEQDRQVGMRAGVTGTPGFIINGEILSGNLGEESFDKFIDEALAAARKQQVAAR